MKYIQLLISISIVVLSSACSILLDPENCTSNADCQGGICQEGICVGEIKVDQKDKDLSDAMQDISIEDMQIDDMKGMEDQKVQITDMMMLVDQSIDDMTWLFTCDFDPVLDRNGTTEYAVYQNKVYSKLDQIKIPLTIVLPTALSTDHIKLKTGSQGLTVDLIQENSAYYAQLNFDAQAQGEFVITLEISDQQIYCTQILTVVRDVMAPQISLISPSNTSALFGLGSSPERTELRALSVLIDANDQTPMTVYIDGQVADGMLVGFSSQSFTLSLMLSGGNNDFVIEVEDLLGQRSAPLLLNYSYDQIKPTLVLDPLPNQINQPQFTFSGLVTDAITNDMAPQALNRGQISLIRQDSNQQVISVVEVDTDENGRFSGTVNLSLGLNSVKVCAQDAAENQRCQLIQNIQYNPPAPCINITSPRFRDLLSFDVTGTTCESVTRINAYLDGRNLGSYSPSNQVNSNGLKTFTIPLQLSNFASNQTLRVEAFTNTVDQAPAIQEMVLVADNTPAEVSITQPVNQLCTSESTIQFCANVVDPESQIAEARVKGVVVNHIMDGSFCTNVDLINGLQNLLLSVTNGAGLSSSQQVSVTRDNIAPQINFDLAEQSWYPVLDNRVVIAGSINVQGCAINAQGLRVKTRLSNGTFGPTTNPSLSGGRFNYATGINLSGDYAIQAEITDTANNTRTVDYAFKADAIAPQINILEPVLNATYTQSANATIRFTALDIHSGLQRILVNQQQINFTLNNGIAEVTHSVSLNPGVNQIEIKAIDAVGFEQIKTITIERDITPPVITILEPAVNKGLHSKERVIVSVQDNASGVNRVVINGTDAIQSDQVWIADGVAIDELNPVISAYAIDMVGNQSQNKQQAGLFFSYAIWYPSQSGLSTHVFENINWLSQNGVSLLAYAQSNNSNSASIFKKTLSGQGMGFQEQALNQLPKFTIDAPQNPILIGTIANTQSFLAVGINQNQYLWNSWYFNIQGQILTRASDLDDTRVVHAQVWVDLNSDSRLDLLSVVSNPDLSLINGNTTTVLAFSQNIDGTFTLESTDDLGLTGISTYSRLCVADVNQDSLPDVIAGNSNGAMMWKRVLGGASNFENEANFTSRALDDCLSLDWDHDGKLDLITRFGSQLYRTEYDGSWTNQSLNLINQNIKGWLVTDLDFDLSQEIFVYGTDGISLWDQTGEIDLETLGIRINLPVYSADIIDFDHDLDEDIALATSQGILLVLANRSFISETVNPIVLKIKRGDSLSVDAYFTQVFLDLDRNNSFERVIQARSNSSTLLYINSAISSQINVKVTFPDQGTPLNHNKNLINRSLGTTVDVIDAQ